MSKPEAYVITIMNNEKSLSVAKRCINSAKKFGIECHHWEAKTPADNILSLYEKEGIDPSRFDSKYSRIENCMSAFYSHYSLWKKCVELNTNIIIFEHDAIMVNDIPKFLNFRGCINLGKPSYGNFKIPRKLGINPLTSKGYFPGAHAYMISPRGAKEMIALAKIKAEPTDVFLRLENFSWLEEYYPWPAECKDNFTTIQHENGCAAKHGYNSDYTIEELN